MRGKFERDKRKITERRDKLEREAGNMEARDIKEGERGR